MDTRPDLYLILRFLCVPLEKSHVPLVVRVPHFENRCIRIYYRSQFEHCVNVIINVLSTCFVTTHISEWQRLNQKHDDGRPSDSSTWAATKRASLDPLKLTMWNSRNRHSWIKSKSNHFYCHITTAQVPWWVKFLWACSRQCKKQQFTYGQYIFTVHIGVHIPESLSFRNKIAWVFEARSQLFND